MVTALWAIKKFNRRILEFIYPELTPKSSKEDYSKQYTLTTVKKAIDDIIIRKGLKTGITYEGK